MPVFAKDFVFDGAALSSKINAYALVGFDNAGSSVSAILDHSVKRTNITLDNFVTDIYTVPDNSVFKFD